MRKYLRKVRFRWTELRLALLTEMQKLFKVIFPLSALLALIGCGDSLDTLNRLAAAGSIHQGAPVTAEVQIQIAATPAKVWSLLIDAPSWPKWQSQIDSVGATGPLTNGSRFWWRTGSTNIHSQVQLFEPERRLSWTGTAFTAKAIHVWKLDSEPDNQTLVTVSESMDGLLMAQFFPSKKLKESDAEWLRALKLAAEQQP
jgi:uncharacterized protein YndB with AHSA1/START domain